MNVESTTHARDLRANREKLAADIAAVAAEAGELLKEFSDETLQRTHVALTQAQSAIADTAGQFGDTASGYVHAHPWRAMGFAGAAGLVLGLLLARR